MSFSLTPLLLHSEHVPVGARRALREAAQAPAHERTPHLESAARILYRQAELDLTCDDARELVGLPAGDDCCQ
jgi:RES domain-containing protein